MRQWLRLMGYLEEGLMATAVLLVVIINFISIVTRDFNLGIQFGQAQEVMLMMFVWITFLGIPLAARYKAHLGLSILTEALPPRIRRVVAHVALTVSLAFLAILAYYGTAMVRQEYLTGETTPALGLPTWPFGAAVAVSAVLTIIRMLEVAYEDLWRRDGREVTGE